MLLILYEIARGFLRLNIGGVVSQGCLMLLNLFLTTLHEILRAVVDNKNRVIRWSFSKHLEDLDYADIIWLLSLKVS